MKLLVTALTRYIRAACENEANAERLHAVGVCLGNCYYLWKRSLLRHIALVSSANVRDPFFR